MKSHKHFLIFEYSSKNIPSCSHNRLFANGVKYGTFEGETDAPVRGTSDSSTRHPVD